MSTIFKYFINCIIDKPKTKYRELRVGYVGVHF